MNELTHADVHPLELHRRMFKLLPDIVRSNEHIEAVAYGLNEKHWHGMLVATDRRVIYLEGDLIFSSMEEAPYEIVQGVQHTKAPLRIGLTLNTREHDYPLSYVKKDCAARFVSYIEDRVEKMDDLPSGFNSPYDSIKRINKRTQTSADKQSATELPLTRIYGVQRDFLKDHHQLVVTGTDREGKLLSQEMRYYFHNNALYIVADKELSKNFVKSNVLLCSIRDEATDQTLQLQAILHIEMNPAVLSLGLEADGEVAGSDICRLTVLDLAFVIDT